MRKSRIKRRYKVFRNWKGTLPFYVNELFISSQNPYNTRSHMALESPLRKGNLGQKSITFMIPSIWNNLSNDLEIFRATVSFNHNSKASFEKLK